MFLTTYWKVPDLTWHGDIPNEDHTIHYKDQIRKVNNAPKANLQVRWYVQIVNNLLKEIAKFFLLLFRFRFAFSTHTS